MFQWFDSLVNLTTGLGVFGKDPTTTAHYHLHVLDRNELENAYRSDWIARAIVDAPAEDATREWRGWFGNADEIEKLEEVEKKLYLQRKMRLAIIRARLYGGAGLVLGIDDGRNTWEPVDWDACDTGCLKFVVVLNRYELMAGPRIYNVFSEWYTRPEYYTVATPLFGFHYEAGGTYPTMSGSNPNLLPAQRESYGQNTPWLRGAVNKAKSLFTGQEEGDYARQVTPSDGMVKMHPERVIELTGNELPDWRLVPMGGWWGDSVLQTADEMLKDFGLTIGGIANMVNDAKMDVIKVPGLSKSLANQEYANRLIQRFQVANLAKSTINALLLEGGPPDKAEEWQRISTSFSALPQIMHEYMTIAGAAGGIPMSRLMGSAPGRGLAKEGGGGGDVDIRNYYDRITSRQESEYRPALHPLDKAVKLSALGKDDPDVSYAWNPLYKENPLEQAQVALAKAQAYQIDVNAGLINSDVLREARINQLDADEIYPGLQDAIDQFGSEPEEPETPPWTPQSGAPGFPSASSGVPAKPAIPGAPAQKALPAPAKGPQSAIPPKPGVQLAKPVADRLLNEMAFLRDEIAVLRRPWADTVEAHVIEDFDPDEPRDQKGEWTAGGSGWEKLGRLEGPKASAAEKSALSHYMTDGFTINSILRDPKGTQSHMFDKMKATGEAVSGWLAKAKLPEATTVYRGIAPRAAAKMMAHLKVGAVFEDKGFMSTSLNKDVASQYGTDRKGVIMEIHAPKGAQGASIGGFKKSYKELAEVVFQRGSRLKLTSYDKKAHVAKFELQK